LYSNKLDLIDSSRKKLYDKYQLFKNIKDKKKYEKKSTNYIINIFYLKTFNKKYLFNNKIKRTSRICRLFL